MTVKFEIAFLSACVWVVSSSAFADMLEDSGFKKHPMTDAHIQKAHEHKVVPHKFVQIKNGDKSKWVYFDPLACSCLYSGSDNEMGNYRQKSWAARVNDMDYIRTQQLDSWMSDDVLGGGALGIW